ncbi:MAG: rod shape-determining protein RodA [Fusobacteriota bacterium]
MKQSQDYHLIKRKTKKFDLTFILNIIILIGISLLMIYSATINKNGSFFKKEILWAVIGFSVFIIASLINYRKYYEYAYYIYILMLLFLISVPIFGKTILGAKRWIDLGIVTIQPSEFARLFVILTFSQLLTKKFRKGIKSWWDITRTGMHLILPFLLILQQPDLGTSLVLAFIYILLVFINKIEIKKIIIMIGTGIALIPFAYFFVLKEYQKSRITVFLNPEEDILGAGWNLIQSKIAVGSGQIFGKGLFSGTQNKLNFLPESHTDFIFSVFAEEFGFVGSIIFLIVYLSLILKIFNIGKNSNSRYGKLISFGIGGLIFFNSFVNMGMTMGIMPITGLPLLLVSYGGSSFVVTFLMLGIVHSVKIHNNK